MTSADRDLFRGWQAAQKNQPFEPHESDEWKEGYRLWLKSKRRAA